MARKSHKMAKNSQNLAKDAENAAKIFGVPMSDRKDYIKQILEKITKKTEHSEDDKEIIKYIATILSGDDIKESLADKISTDKLENIEKAQTELNANKKSLAAEREQLATDQAQLDADRAQLDADRAQVTADQDALVPAQAQLATDRAQLDADREIYRTDVEKTLKVKIYEEYRAQLEKLCAINNDQKAIIREYNTYKDNYEQLQRSNENLGRDNAELQQRNNSLEQENQQLLSRHLELEQEQKNGLDESRMMINGFLESLKQDIGRSIKLAQAMEKKTAAEIDKCVAQLERQTLEYKNAKAELDKVLESGDVFDGLANIKISGTPDMAGTLRYNSMANSLADFCNKFRAYAQNAKQLYYDQETICAFVAGLSMSHIMILEGKSGTGKTSLPRVFAEFLGDRKLTSVIPVQPSWKDKFDLLGFYNDFTKKFKETDFLKALYFAALDQDNIHIILLDEMNLSRVEYYFADFLSVLELDPQDWQINLLPGQKSSKVLERAGDGQSIKILNNLWFVGTANNDASTFDITDKVYDRAGVLKFDKLGVPDASLANVTVNPCRTRATTLNGWFDKAGRFDVGDTLDTIDAALDVFDIVITNRIKNQMSRFVPVYCACKGDHNATQEAIDIILCTKVLRKLDALFLDQNNLDDLNKLHGSLAGLSMSQEYITKKMDKIVKSE